MNESSLRELGLDLLEDRQFERALAVFAEAVRRIPADHRARMLAARCLSELGERERAVTVYHACAEGLLRRDYLLSAMAACKLGLELAPQERRLRETLVRLHARAARNVAGRASVPPPLPPETLFDGKVETDIMSLSGEELSDRAIEVLAAPDPGGTANPNDRPPLPLFADLELDAFIDLVGRMGLRSIKPEEVVSVEGEASDRLHVIVAGKAEVTRRVEGEDRTLGFLGGGSIFGELTLLTGAPPSVTIMAVSDMEVFEIRREHLNAVAKNHPSVPQVLANFAHKRMERNLTATSPLFQPMPESERAALLQRFSFRALQPGEKVLVEGEHSPGLFLVLAGELVVQKDDPAGGAVRLGVLREGEVAGEISLLTGLRATATVLSVRKTATAFLERAAFHELVKTYPHIKKYLEQLSDRRLKQIGEALRPAEILDADELLMESEGTGTA
ncbi:cyclic nucleotide-binding domain-containing protein [Archangium minus]|uniref:Cyclic nucleotide-binding domain-containing protein n=1 Tax=Archangium minus TaxID=83450 RepID=A0ABY9WQ21_9BACT|nr:cyclic nucleotide-binding domain-containing protein [Archangium violaceum]WNG45740.1 cyclic nucleotide-binding domain-containing protein [Archangium minus]